MLLVPYLTKYYEENVLEQARLMVLQQQQMYEKDHGMSVARQTDRLKYNKYDSSHVLFKNVPIKKNGNVKLRQKLK